MPSNPTTVTNFYQAFSRLDADAMAECYAEGAQFADEAFHLRGKREVMGMWRMLFQATQAGNRADWKLEWGDLREEGAEIKVRWEEDYRFGVARRSVHNCVLATFTFDEEGKILTHHDRFNLWRWSRMALGVPGAVLGWSPAFRKLMGRQARANLDKFLASNTTPEAA